MKKIVSLALAVLMLATCAFCFASCGKSNDDFVATDATDLLKEDFGIGGGKSIDDYNAIRYMKKGDISAAFRTSDMSGNEMCKIIKLLDVIPAHNATLDEDYLRLEQIALEKKQEKAFQQWLDTKIEAMYIYIAPEYRQGEFVNKNWVKKDQK